jgi:hypothetical protein
MKCFILLVVLTLFGMNSVVGQKNIATQNGSWFMYFGNHKLSEKYSLHTEYQWRRSDFVYSWQQSLARIGLDYHLDKNNSLTAGYGWIVSYPYGSQPISYTTNEHRVWEEFISNSNYSRLNFNHRYRIEQRFIERITTNSLEESIVSGYNFKQRARYRFMIVAPINNASMKDKTAFVSLYNEVFLGFGQGISKNILDQNRLYGSIGWRFNKNSNIQLGYLNQIIVKSNGVDIERNHNLQFSWTYNLDFSKKVN